MMDNLVTILPNAASLIESMRSIGYSFETAIADIIDNSISAKATKIEIFERKNNGLHYVQIIDNGLGMTNDELIEAMRLGSKNPIEKRDKDDLGRFGLGLKSASFSQCRVLTVVSKKNGEINGYQWDLDLVQKTDGFDVIRLIEDDFGKFQNISELENLESGTIVQWEDFDRISDSAQDLDSELGDLMNKAIDHIALIFHRFIDDGLEISVNFEPVLAKDPFLIKHRGTQELKEKKVKIEGETIYLYPYVLPHYTKLSQEDKRKSGKINEHFKSQGFYLYRNKRLIVWGDYLGLAKKSELGKNVRIKVDIPNSLDYLWEIDVKKSRANVPSKIKKNLLSVISDGEMASKSVNTFRGKREIGKIKPLWEFFEERDGNFHFEINRQNDHYLQFISSLDENQKRLFEVFLKSLTASVPYQTIYAQISDGNEIHNNYDDLVETLDETVHILRENNLVNMDTWLKSLLSEEPYASNKNAIEYINKELGD